jgi:hypothetical protein
MDKNLFNQHISTLLELCEYSEGVKSAIIAYNSTPELIKNVVYAVYLAGYPHKYVMNNVQKIAYDAVYEIALKINRDGYYIFD